MSNPSTHSPFDPAILTPEVKGVLVDLDNTLYEYAPAHEKAVEAARLAYGAKVSPEDFAGQYSRAQKAVKARTKGQAASHSRLLYFQAMVEARDGKAGPAEALRLEEAYWSAFIAAIRLRPQAVAFLEECERRGLPVCVVTDLTSSVQFSKMMATGLDRLAGHIVTSEEAGVEKPHPAIFSLALEKLGLRAEEAIMIGDDDTKDIQGAAALGIKAYLA